MARPNVPAILVGVSLAVLAGSAWALPILGRATLLPWTFVIVAAAGWLAFHCQRLRLAPIPIRIQDRQDNSSR